jgi:hypothetical protein
MKNSSIPKQKNTVSDHSTSYVYNFLTFMLVAAVVASSVVLRRYENPSHKSLICQINNNITISSYIVPKYGIASSNPITLKFL